MDNSIKLTDIEKIEKEVSDISKSIEDTTDNRNIDIYNVTIKELDVLGIGKMYYDPRVYQTVIGEEVGITLNNQNIRLSYGINLPKTKTEQLKEIGSNRLIESIVIDMQKRNKIKESEKVKDFLKDKIIEEKAIVNEKTVKKSFSINKSMTKLSITDLLTDETLNYDITSLDADSRKEISSFITQLNINGMRNKTNIANILSNQIENIVKNGYIKKIESKSKETQQSHSKNIEGFELNF